MARSALEAALELEPGDPQLLRTLADVCVEERDFEGAADHLQAILGVAEDNANARRDAAVRLIRLFRSRDMLPELTQRQDEILKADSADLGALYVLAKIDVVRHRRASAVEHLELLLEQLETCTALQAMERLYQLRYNGPITFHFENGTPKIVEAVESHRRGLQDLRLTPSEEIAQTPK